MFWRELSAANPDALVLLSVRDPEKWYRSASDTIFQSFAGMPAPLMPWMDAVRKGLHERFCDDFENASAMMDAFVRHNDAVRHEIPASRLLVWETSDGWEPICDRLGVPVPDEPLPVTNSTNETRAMIGLAPLP
jgi:hypothetical protein